MKKIKIFILALAVEVLLFTILAVITYSNGTCLENDNWYWTTVTSSNQDLPTSCPMIPSNPPAASVSSKVKFRLFETLLIVMPITAIVSIVYIVKNKDTTKTK